MQRIGWRLGGVGRVFAEKGAPRRTRMIPILTLIGNQDEMNLCGTSPVQLSH